MSKDVDAAAWVELLGLKKDARAALLGASPGEEAGAGLARVLTTVCAFVPDGVAVLFAVRDCPTTGVEADAAAAVCRERCPPDEPQVVDEARAFLECRREATAGLRARAAATLDLGRFELRVGNLEGYATAVDEAARAGDAHAGFVALVASCGDERNREDALAAIAALEGARHLQQGKRQRIHGLLVDTGVAWVIQNSPLRDDPSWAARRETPSVRALLKAEAAMMGDGEAGNLQALDGERLAEALAGVGRR